MTTPAEFTPVERQAARERCGRAPGRIGRFGEYITYDGQLAILARVAYDSVTIRASHSDIFDRIVKDTNDLPRALDALDAAEKRIEELEAENARLKGEVERLQDCVRFLRKEMRRNDPGSHAEQSWDDYCRETEMMVSGEWKMEER